MDESSDTKLTEKSCVKSLKGSRSGKTVSTATSKLKEDLEARKRLIELRKNVWKKKEELKTLELKNAEQNLEDEESLYEEEHKIRMLESQEQDLKGCTELEDECENTLARTRAWVKQVRRYDDSENTKDESGVERNYTQKTTSEVHEVEVRRHPLYTGRTPTGSEKYHGVLPDGRLVEVKADGTDQKLTGKNVIACDNLSMSEKLSKPDISQRDIGKRVREIVVKDVTDKDLPRFNGNPIRWAEFKSTYDLTTEKYQYDNSENLARIRKSLVADAYEAVVNLFGNADNVPKIMMILERQFGRPEAVLKAIIKNIEDVPIPDQYKPTAVLAFGRAVVSFTSTASSLQNKAYLENPYLLQSLVDKLPVSMRRGWIIWARRSGREQNLSNFSEWIEEEMEVACDMDLVSKGPATRNDDSKKSYKRACDVHRVYALSTERNGICNFCNKKGHCMSNCFDFSRKTAKEKWEILKTSKLCFSCLEIGHRAFQCTRRRRCGINGCTKFHHRTLHESKGPVQGSNGEVSNNYSNQVAEHESSQNNGAAPCKGAELIRQNRKQPSFGEEGNGGESTQNVLTLTRTSGYRAIIPVRISGTSTSSIKYVLVDTGADDTLMMAKTAEVLGLDGPPCRYSFTGATGQSVTESTKMVSCEVKGLFRGAQNVFLRNVIVISHMSLQPYTLDLEQLRKDYPHLRRIRGKSLKGVIPDIIVGMDNLQHIVTKQTIEGPPGTPIAVRCNLGWIIGGTSSDKSRGSVCHVAAIWKEENDALHQMVKSFFTLETFGVSGQKKNLTTKIEQRAEGILEKTGCFLSDQKRWEVGLLYVDDNVCFPESYDNAYSRLLGIERRMKKDVKYANSYCKQIREYKDKGYISLVDGPKLQESKTWYLPHFAVFNPNKPGKFRLVFDAASKVKGVSLNSQLLTGVDRLLRIDEVLVNFRLHDVILTGDVNEMFHRVMVRKEDQASQQFLWRDGEFSREPDRYQMNVLIFGASSSPTTAIFVMNKNADRFCSRYPRAVKAIKGETYMDDVLTGGSNEEEVIKLRKDISFICEEGGFTVAKWQSNSNKVLESIPADLCADSTKEVAQGRELEMSRTLGMWIDHERDCFTYLCRFQKVEPAILEGKCPTKRELCRLVMSIFDPLGLVGHFKIKGLMLLQATWRSGIGWDDEVPEEVFRRWKIWMCSLKDIENVSVPRRYAPAIQAAEFVQIHTFVDASKEGFAAVSYLRTQKGNQTYVTLVASKSRVSPIKKQTIPRLELLAAVLGVRLATHICSIMHIKIDRRVFWCDSRTVLGWIRSEAINFKEFVANRVSELQESSDASEWRWVPTALNVADEATRFDKVADLRPTARWFTGPEFLREDEKNWPMQDKPKLDNNDDEVAVVLPVQVNSVIGCKRLERFSIWNRMVRSYAAEEAAFMYWRHRARARICENKGVVCNTTIEQPWEIGKRGFQSNLNSQSLRAAEVRILKEVQQEAFDRELQILRNGGRLTKKCCFRRLRVQMGTDGLLRIKGRIGAAAVDPDLAMPILLPKDHHVTRLIVEDEHRRNAHVGQDTIFNNLRQRFWVIDGRTTVRRICINCQQCKVDTAKPIVPEMGNLPWYRLAYRQPPFTFTGIDFFGPLEVTVGRRREKRWGCICVCLVTRAVHLEVAYGLSTDELMLVLSRFVDVRGKPRFIVSDNGTNMVGANREIKEAVSEMDLSSIKAHPRFRGLEWRFIPPASPHFGGVWEALVKTVKTAIFHILKEKYPKDQVLMTVFKGAENIVNSRPLYHVSSDPEDPESLTPNHFLRGGFDAGPAMPGVFDSSDEFRRKQWRNSQLLLNNFWKRWVNNYLPTLVRGRKWSDPTPIMKVGDVVFIVDDQKPRNTWSRGMISAVFPGEDGIVRVVDVTRYDTDKKKKVTYRRPVHKVCPIGGAM